MFLLRLMHITPKEPKKEFEKKNNLKNTTPNNFEEKEKSFNFKSETIDQIKNITQEKKIKPDTQTDVKGEEKIFIKSFDQLYKICTEKKEIKLKYELEKNVNLVRFEKNRIEISFNDQLDKNFVKDLSLRLFEWTNQRWIITFSKEKGEASIKDKEKNKKIELFENVKKTELYKNFLKKFPDANLIDANLKKEEEN